MSKVKVGVTGGVLALAAGVVMLWEGYVPRTYIDPVGIPTACYGHTGEDVRVGATYTRKECQALLEGDLAIALAGVNRCIHVPLQSHEAAALVSFVFNVGERNFCGSTLARRINRGELPAACAELSKWVYAKGRKLPGLVNRRAQERALCEGKLT